MRPLYGLSMPFKKEFPVFPTNLTKSAEEEALSI